MTGTMRRTRASLCSGSEGRDVAYLERAVLERIGFGSLGDNVQVSDKASLYNVAAIHLGCNVRIDDYCVLSAGAGGIYVGNYVHIAVFCLLIGAGAIRLDDFSGLSSRVSIYSSSDDYSGAAMTNPTVPRELTNVHSADVTLSKHVIVGSGAVILPGVIIHEGAAVGALSLVSKPCEAFGVYSGTPARRIATRSRTVLDLERELLSRNAGNLS
jgi:dTDP-4-amino-4,6-dideoxy-D-glucose acyltransferase